MKLTRTLALFLFVPLLFFGSVAPVRAASFWDLFFSNTSVEKNVDKTINAVVKSEDEGTPSHESFVDNNLLNVQTSALLFIAGPPDSATSGKSTLSEEQKRIVYERYGHGAIGTVGSGITALYTPPASSTTYIADLLHSARIVPQAQAQGLGFSSLDPILGAWKIFRNVAYMFFVLVFLVIGFMIMFRQKIGGQTVVTAQQAIPGIIIALIFVTFSYAIAGFMIDLMYLLMYLMIGLFNPPGGTAILDDNIFGAVSKILVGQGDGLSVFSSVGDAIGQLVGSFAGDLIGDIGDALGWISGITAALVVGIAVFIAAFKIFFELLKTYVSIVISIALAPLTLMMGAFPGQNNFFKWLKGLAGNLMAFPVVLMSFIIYHLFTQSVSGSGGVGQGGFIPPFLPGRGAANAIVTLVGIGILLVIPEVIQQVKKAFGAEGGIAETLVGKAGAAAKSDGLRWAVPGTYLAAGAARDIVGGFDEGLGGGPQAILTAVGKRLRQGLPDRWRAGTDMSASIENVLEGKLLDPNSVERLLRQNLTVEQRKRAAEEREKENKTNKPTG